MTDKIENLTLEQRRDMRAELRKLTSPEENLAAEVRLGNGRLAASTPRHNSATTVHSK